MLQFGLKVRDCLGGAQVTVVNAQSSHFVVIGSGDAERSGSADLSQVRVKTSPAVDAGGSAVTEDPIDDESDHLGAAIDHDCHVMPFSRR